MSEAPTTPTPEAPASAPLGQIAEASPLAASLFPEGGGTPPANELVGEAIPVTPPSSETPPVEPVAEPPKAEEAPETSSAPAYDLKLPEGFTADDALLTDAQAVFAEVGVPADKAQALIDLYTKAATKANEAALAAYTTQQTEWLATINAMPEFQGATKETSLQAIGRLWDIYGTPEAKEALNLHGIGNNPALAKFMLNLANALDEGVSVPAGRPAPNANARGPHGKSIGQLLFPDAPN